MKFFVEISDVSPRQKKAFSKMDDMWAEQAAEMCRRGWFRGRHGVLSRARQHCKNSGTLGGRGVLAFVYMEFAAYCHARAWRESGALMRAYWTFTAWLYSFAASYSSNMVEEMLGGIKRLSTAQLLLRAELLLARGEYSMAGACAEEGLRRRVLTLSQEILLKCILAECLTFYKEDEETHFLYKELGEIAASRHREIQPQVLIQVYCVLARHTLELYSSDFKKEEEVRREARALFQRAIKIAIEKKWVATALVLEAEAECLCGKQC